MRKLLLLALSLQAGLFGYGQQDPQVSQTRSSRFLFNPAVAGHSNQLCGLLLSRQQWVGFTGRPSTEMIALHGPVNRINSGVGLQLVRDRVGSEKTLSVHGAYAYRLFLEHGTLSGGLSLGWTQKSLSADWNLPSEQIGPDPQIPDAGVSGSQLDLGAGLYYQQRKFYAGISTTHIHEPILTLSRAGRTFRYRLARHYYLMAGYRKDYRQFSVLPALWVRSDGVATQLDVNLMISWQDRVRFGASFRPGDAVVPMVRVSQRWHGMNIWAGYSYDVTTNDIRRSSYGSHELAVGFCKPFINRTKWRNVRTLGPRNYDYF